MSPEERHGGLLIQPGFLLNLMNLPNRDLLILFNQELMTPRAIEQAIEEIHEILYDVERVDNLALSHEVIDVSKNRVNREPFIIRRQLRSRELPPFVFMNCRN